MRIWLPVLLLVCLLAGHARAGDKAAAEAAFQQGKDLMKAGRYGEACVAFEKSLASDAQLGTEYNLASCYEKAGKLASAWAAFRELAQRDGNAARKADSERHAAALQPRLIKLLIGVRAPVPGLEVTRNDQDVTPSVGIESPVDPGEYEIGAVAAGYKPWSVKVSAQQEGGTVQVTVPELERLPVEPTPADGRALEPLPTGDGAAPAIAPSSGHRTLGLSLGAGGVAVTAGGLVLGYLAMSKHDHARDLCAPGDLGTGCNPMGFAEADQAERSARTFGNVSTVMVGVGAAALVTGVVLYLTSPSPSDDRAEHASLQVAPAITPDGFAVTAVRAF
jgi:hypothetical protein